MTTSLSFGAFTELVRFAYVKSKSFFLWLQRGLSFQTRIKEGGRLASDLTLFLRTRSYTARASACLPHHCNFSYASSFGKTTRCELYAPTLVCIQRYVFVYCFIYAEMKGLCVYTVTVYDAALFSRVSLTPARDVRYSQPLMGARDGLLKVTS